MRNKYKGIKTLGLCLGAAVFISANTNICAYATGAGIQLGTDISDEVAPQPSDEAVTATEAENVEGQTENTDAEGTPAEGEEATAAEGEEAEAAEEVPATAESTNVIQTEAELNADSKVAYVEVEKYTIEGGLLESGNELTINLTVRNISSVAAAESLVMTMSSESSMIYPKYGTDNQIFIGKLLPKESKTISIPVTVSSKFEGDATDFSCRFDYLSLDNKISNTSSMIITTSSGKGLIVKSMDLSSHAILNGKSLLSISYSNKSNGNITDAQLLIDGNVAAESKIIRLDTVYAGKNYTKDYNVTFTKAGNQDVSVKLVYTDVTGERLQADLGSYSVTVSDEVTARRGSTTSKALLWGGRALAGIVLLVAFVFGFIYFKKR